MNCASVATLKITTALARLVVLMRPVTRDDTMSKNPFIDDPRDVVARHVALAVQSPIEEVRAIHIRTAEHYAEIAKDSGLAFNACTNPPSGRS